MRVAGWKIGIQREEYGISRSTLAAKLGWSEKMLADIEAGTAETEGDCMGWIFDALEELSAKKNG
jgi:ribosome-binding protein aMBF1 (putative translation factor)